MRTTSNNRSRNISRILGFLSVVLVVAGMASPAFAHDNIGGDELSMATAIFIAGMVAFSGALVALIWAARGGQFADVEGPKYTMLSEAPDLDDLPAIDGSPAVRQRTRRAATATAAPKS